MQNLQQGMSVRKAMIKAGYSIQTANHGVTNFKSKSFISAVQDIRKELLDIGVTPQRIAKKINDLLDAKKAIVVDKQIELVDDNQIQSKTVDQVRDIWGMGEGDANGKVKRRLTVEEFIEDNA